MGYIDKTYNNLLEKFNLGLNIKELHGNFTNDISFNLDKTYKVIDYNYKFSGKIKKSKIKFVNTLKNNFEVKNLRYGS